MNEDKLRDYYADILMVESGSTAGEKWKYRELDDDISRAAVNLLVSAHIASERKLVSTVNDMIMYLDASAHMFADGTMRNSYAFISNIKYKHRLAIERYLVMYRDRVLK